ncbi:hypothetical protein L1887_57547 [Cichorium endivia]|nr:hypothetical protein L1887_57547 [Cichorium endivia]
MCTVVSLPLYAYLIYPLSSNVVHRRSDRSTGLVRERRWMSTSSDFTTSWTDELSTTSEGLSLLQIGCIAIGADPPTIPSSERCRRQGKAHVSMRLGLLRCLPRGVDRPTCSRHRIKFIEHGMHSHTGSPQDAHGLRMCSSDVRLGQPSDYQMLP